MEREQQVEDESDEEEAEEERPSPLYTVYLRVASEDDADLYVDEYSYVIHPSQESLLTKWSDAKRMFSLLYPDAEAVDFSVEVRLASR